MCELINLFLHRLAPLDFVVAQRGKLYNQGGKQRLQVLPPLPPASGPGR
ncbi:MAG: hypothetical protein MUC60_03545 [Oscillatoria sp. Prado101]|nr:hypothetical protein [Oscillatoria sp. Prado101]